MQHEHAATSTHDETGNAWEDRAVAISALRDEHGQEIDAETLYEVRRYAQLGGFEPRPFHVWPDNATIVRDARAMYGADLTDEAGYVQSQREDQALGAEYTMPPALAELFPDARPLTVIPFVGDPWPEDGATLLAHGLERIGLRMTDPEGYVQRRRDEQAAGLPYWAPTDGTRAETAKWDEVYRMRAARGEITGTILDDEVVARHLFKGAATGGWSNLRAALAYRPTGVLLWGCVVLVALMVAEGILAVAK